MRAPPLPYDMGNAGDFIKHGLMAEFSEWWLAHNNQKYTFLDPFGGRPFTSPPHPRVISRMNRLQDCALKRAQWDFPDRYYGSSNVIKNIAHKLNRQARVLVSDRNELAVKDLVAEGFEKISLSGFDCRDSFSIVASSLAQCSPSLLLLDPFDDFLSDYAPDIVPVLPGTVTSNNLPVILFVLCKDWLGELGLKWRQLQEQYLGLSLPQLSIRCAKIQGSEIKGESNFHSEALLVLPPIYQASELQNLVDRLQIFANQLSDILPQEVTYSTLGISGAG